ncbi:hypothetical protein ElyMa_005042200 [Elysia marginata]|uniref:Uncharacterized protein n=1 Tax=Elysia marginata TaxID=1093978 RepID=A0AAV4JCT0_9GAST|nr:hypothetical protein ElyMa_005042200 [Elysia marginata]
MEKDKILERWSEYIKELFDDERKEIEVMKGNFAGPPILKDEVVEWFKLLYPKQGCEQDCLRQTVYRTAEKALAVAAHDLDAFRQQQLLLLCLLQYAPDCVSADLMEYHSLTRSSLLQPELFSGFTLTGNVLTNKAALDLLQFQLNEKQKSQFAAEWICKLLGLDMQPREIKSIRRK